jgi:F-type H+-transporting ATPase subunit delta
MNEKSARATQYAEAIVQAMLERWQAALDQAADALSNNKRARIEEILAPDAPVEIANTLRLMQQQGDLDLVKDVASALAVALSGQREPIKAEIVSAAALSEPEQEQLRRQLSEQFGEGLVFSFRVDPSLLGGLRVRVGDRLIDTSIASRLNALRESLASVVR